MTSSWIKLFTDELKKEEKTMCYDQSRKMLFLDGLHKTIIKPFKFEMKWNERKEIEVKNIEIHITFITKLKKRNLGKLSGFVYKNYPEVRALIHAFNIIRIKDVIYIAQSWFNEQPYHIIQKFKSDRELMEWLELVKKAVDEFGNDPARLFKIFEYETGGKELIKLIKNHDGPFKVEMTIEEVVDYDFKQTKIRYKRDLVDIDLELFRQKQFDIIAEKIKMQLDGASVKKRKYTIDSAIKQNILARIIMSWWTSQQDFSELEDGLFPYNLDEKYEDMAMVIANDTFNKIEHVKGFRLRMLFNDAIDAIRKYKSKKVTYDFFIDEKNAKFNVNGIDFKIPIETYNKLVKRANRSDVNDLILCLLLRYNTLSSGGNQWAMPNNVKEELRQLYGIDFECFASSINHYYDNYCSLFYDIEKHFMSLGPFHTIEYNSGFYMLNPPYVEEVLIVMINVVLNALEKGSGALSFMIGLPKWKNFPSIEQVEKSKYLVERVDIGDGMVKWHDHMTGRDERIPGSVRYILQNEEGKKMISVSEFGQILKKVWIDT